MKPAYASRSDRQLRSQARSLHRRTNRHATKSSGPNLSPFVQAKLRIGAPNGKYEQEADCVADQIIRMPAPAAERAPGIETTTATPDIQRKCASCESGAGPCPKCAEEDILQRRPAVEEEEELLQTKTSGGALDVKTPLHARINSLRTGGQPLPESSRHFFEARFGEDFSNVRIHRDASAAETAKAINARAFTMGRHIAFGLSQYQADTYAGKKLIAHELAHTIQQSPTGRPMIQRAKHEAQADWFDPDNCWVAGETKGPTPNVIGRFIGILDAPDGCEGQIKMTMRFETIGDWDLKFWLPSAGPLLFTPSAVGVDASTFEKGKVNITESFFEYALSLPLSAENCATAFDAYLLMTYRRAGHNPNFAEVKFERRTTMEKAFSGTRYIDVSPDPVVRVDSCGRLDPTDLSGSGATP